MADYDLIIRGGSVIDGTGADARTADVAVVDGVIAEVGAVAGRGRREIDADGALVIPGIVDIHSHYDGQATWDERLQPSSWHGVTTVVTGNCGVGFAPVHDADHDKLIELMEGVEDIPGAALHEGLRWNWNSFGEFLDAVDSIPHDIDVAMQVPHGALRLNVMGERGANHEDATPDDIAAMAELAREGIEAGALGFSTSRTRNHKTSTGAYTPTLTAAPDELIGIAQGVGATGTGVLQVVSDFLDPDGEFAMLREMVATSGRPMSISIARNPMVPDAFRGLLDHLTAANADGLTMTGQVAPRAVGLILGLECTLNPFLTNPVYREIADRPLAERVAALRDPAFRERLLAEAAERSRDKLGGNLIGRFDLLFEMADEPDYEPSLDTSIQAIAVRSGRSADEVALDAMLADDGHGLLYLPVPQLRRREPRRLPRNAGASAHRARPRRRRRPRRHHLRRQLPDHAARLLGARPRPRPHPAPVPRATPLPRHRTHRRVARPRRDRTGLSRRPQRGRLRAAPAAQARDRPRPSGERTAVAAARRRMAPHHRGRPRDLPRRRRHRRPARPPGTRRPTRTDRSTAMSTTDMPISLHDVVELETHANWTAVDIGDPDDWTLQLTDAHHAELDAGLTQARSTTDDVLAVTADDFTLPTLGPLLATMAEELVNGRGFTRIAALDVDRLGAEDASWIYWGIGMHLGEPWPQNAKGHLLGDVKDQGKAPDDPTARGNEIGGHPLGFHSDGSDLVGLLCIDSGVSGGESLVANAVGAHNALVRTRPDLAAVLYEPLPYDFRGEQREGAQPFYAVPAFTRHNGPTGDRLFVRYIRPFIEASQRHADAPRLTALQIEAMDAYDALINDHDNQVEMALRPGDIQFVNNYHVLHGRRRYVDDTESGRVRWLKRLWLATDILGPDDRPARFQRAGAMGHWGERRTRA